MIANYVPRERKVITRYTLVFDDGTNNGFSFPCDEHGKPIDLTPAAQANLSRCLEHPEHFARFNQVIAQKQYFTEPARGTCACGKEIELFDQYLGACECPHCGRWYNLFGQNLLPPNQWEEDFN